ncbi:LysR family transcriptional regulator [Streptomyces nodosus]|uniref:LysR family transcriptional regulator n=1 Tax=Streptomyces nodosus TaxID=40318 RepID=A0A0B5D6W3_9ACTN|nr:LysR family transcriptional regulator [Streptomyces nodosus]AJE38829.1 LysR family transcriptional regulator [Streptomyces nodosus]MBB4789601.1 DNA-binding transcriptional LysR family regulator [Streptomyces nodosus]QEV37408.1 LysR family transcriptional regulator [Streptomyces nodosus]
MDRLLLMHSFVTVAQVGSFSGAAKRLGSSGSLVSRHVAELERQVGVRLVNRTARSVSLTEPGRRYAEFAARILEEIDSMDAGVARLHDRAEGTLSIICPKWIGSLDLGDAIAAFSAAHPKIQVRFELGGMSDRTYDFLDSGFDVAFHTRDLRDSSVRLKKIASLPFVLCASKEYLDRSGPLTDPNGIAHHDCLVHVNDPVWRLGHGHNSTLHKIRNIAFSSNSYLALQKAAVHGRGLALLPQRSAYDDLVGGALEVLLPELPVPDRPLFAIYGPGQATPRKISVFLDFLGGWFSQNPIPDIRRRSPDPAARP